MIISLCPVKYRPSRPTMWDGLKERIRIFHNLWSVADQSLHSQGALTNLILEEKCSNVL